MKKLLYLIFVYFSSINVLSAQNLDDVFRLNEYYHNGSARFNSMGGAFGALGGDLSAISINPAGSSVFIDSEIGFTLGYSENSILNNFNNSVSNSNLDTYSINQLGAVLVYGNRESKLSLGYNFHRLNDYNISFNLNGENNRGLDNYFLYYSNGIPYEDLMIYDGETVQSVYKLLGDEYGFADQQAFLGYQSFIINPDIDNFYKSNAEYSSVSQSIDSSRKGFHNKHSFNLSTTINENFLVGLNINLHEFIYEEIRTFDEFNYDSESSVRRILFFDDLFTNGVGTSFQLGTIINLSRLRVGLSYNSPTWFSIEDETLQSIKTDIRTDDIITEYEVDPKTINYYGDYKIKIPSKTTFSLAYIFGSRGLMSLDYEYSKPNNTKFDDEGGNDSYLFRLNGAILSGFSQSSSSLRLGGEYRIKNYSLRIGSFNYDRILDSKKNKIKGLSFGLGVTFGYFDIDIGYTRYNNYYTNSLFSNGLNTIYSVENSNSSLYTSLTIKL